MGARAIESVYSHWPDLTQESFNELILDFEKFCEEGSMIINKNGEAVRFVLNEAQRAVADLMLPLIFAEIPSPTNVFIHKSRQLGITTILGKIEQYCATRLKNFNTNHVMPTEDDADDIFENKFVPQIQATHPELVPDTYKTERTVKFRDFGGVALNSTIRFSSAMKLFTGGATNQMVVEDEHAYYERVAALERGLIGTLPKVGRAIRVIVSTAHGMNHFYDQSKIAKKSHLWHDLFLPWHMVAEYEMEPTGRLAELRELTEYELKLCDIFEEYEYPVSSWARKMQWWQYTFETEAKRDMEHMFENYPSSPEESFAASGNPVLPSDKLYKLQEEDRPYEFVELTEDISGRIQLKTVLSSSIKLFKRPIQGHRYIFGADPADGDAKGDDSAAVLIDIDTMEDVLCIKDKLEQNDFAELLAHIGRIYNTATIVPERNTGQAMIQWLVNICKYPRIYVDAIHTTSVTVAYGVYMTRPVKNEAIIRMKFLLNNNIYTDYDPDFLDDALHFIWKKTPSGLAKAIGTDGHHDDTVMARLIAMLVIDMRKWSEYKSDGTN